MNNQLRKAINSIIQDIRSCYSKGVVFPEDEIRPLLDELSDVLDENETNLDNYSENLKSSGRVMDQMDAQDNMVDALQDLMTLFDDEDELDLSEVDNLLDTISSYAEV